MLDVNDILVRIVIRQLHLESLIQKVCQQGDQREPVEVKVDGLCLVKLGEARLDSVGIVEDVVDKYFANDEAGNDHCDVFLPQLNFSLKQALVLFYVGDLMRQFEQAIEANDVGQLSLLELDEELGWDGQLAKRDH